MFIGIASSQEHYGDSTIAQNMLLRSAQTWLSNGKKSEQTFTW